MPNNIRLKLKHYFIMNIPNKTELLQQIAFNNSSDNFDDFVEIYKKCTAKQYSFLASNTKRSSEKPLNLFLSDHLMKKRSISF